MYNAGDLTPSKHKSADGIFYTLIYWLKQLNWTNRLRCQLCVRLLGCKASTLNPLPTSKVGRWFRELIASKIVQLSDWWFTNKISWFLYFHKQYFLVERATNNIRIRNI